MAKRRFDTKTVAKKLGLKVREMRNERGWTLEQCEEYGWINWRHLQQVESGRNVKLETIVNLANLFGVRPAELLADI